MEATKTKHTPGDWIADDGDAYVRESTTGATIARVCEDDGHVDRKVRRSMPAKANARLIAAAPDLLAALKDVVLVIHGEGLAERFKNVLPGYKAAIARAEGGAA